MLVKVEANFFVNTDHVVYVRLTGSIAQLKLRNCEPQHISAAAASYLLQNMDVASAVVLPGEENYGSNSEAPEQPLASRIAQALRDTFINGATFDELRTLGPDKADALHTALDALIKESVIVEVRLGGHTIFYHATHRPGKPAPQPEIDVDYLRFIVCSKCFHLKKMHTVNDECTICGDFCEGFITSTHDPLVEGEALASRPGEDIDSKANQTTDD